MSDTKESDDSVFSDYTNEEVGRPYFSRRLGGLALELSGLANRAFAEWHRVDNDEQMDADQKDALRLGFFAQGSAYSHASKLVSEKLID